MKKQLSISLAVLAAMTMGVVGMSAFEAHIVNVTATIENSLTVDTDAIEFGTVFPQEEIDGYVNIALSNSFLNESDVEAVSYMIRQKPKCGYTMDDGKILLDLPTATGHVQPDGSIVCPDLELTETPPVEATYGVLPSLCEYLSKHKSPDDQDAGLNQGEVELDAFHKPWWIEASSTGPFVKYNEAIGLLKKGRSNDDIEDKWVIDLKVPCFEGQCAQDWKSYVGRINPSADPLEFIQPRENEHKIFGCDLWIEVTGIDRPGIGQ